MPRAFQRVVLHEIREYNLPYLLHWSTRAQILLYPYQIYIKQSPLLLIWSICGLLASVRKEEVDRLFYREVSNKGHRIVSRHCDSLVFWMFE